VFRPDRTCLATKSPLVQTHVQVCLDQQRRGDDRVPVGLEPRLHCLSFIVAVRSIVLPAREQLGRDKGLTQHLSLGPQEQNYTSR
jgi:hypothetical protein